MIWDEYAVLVITASASSTALTSRPRTISAELSPRATRFKVVSYSERKSGHDLASVH